MSDPTTTTADTTVNIAEPAPTTTSTLPTWAIADLRKSGIRPEEAVARRIYACADGYIIPFMDPATGKPMLTPDGKPFARKRLEKPGPKCKYLSDKGAGVHIYIPAEVHRHLLEAPEAPIVATEGEKKAICATLRGLHMLGLCGIDCWSAGRGSHAINPDFRPYLARGREFIVLYDSDAGTPDKEASFSGAAARMAAALEPHGVTLSKVVLPQLPGQEKTGVDDYLMSGKNVADLMDHIRETKIEVRPRKVAVRLPGGPVGNLDAIRALCEAVAPHQQLYIRSGECVGIGTDDSGAVHFEPLTPAAAASEFELYAWFERMARTKNGDEPKYIHASLTEQTARLILSSPEFARHMPEIRRLCDYQQPLWHHGKIILPPKGYSPELKTYTRLDAPAIEPMANVAEAVDAILEILVGFCFATSPRTEANDLFLANAIAYLLTAHCRLLFEPERAPLFYAEGNRPGCGKDYLLGLPVVLTTGAVEPEFFPPAKDSEESRKRLFSLARTGSRFYLVSNYKGHLDDPALEAAATSPTLADRVLGVSDTRSYPNTAIYGLSGNGLTYSEDLARRCIRLKLAYFGESTETRTFARPDLYGHVRANRARYLSALHTLVEAWRAGGCKPGTKSKASFTRWAQVIGGIMEACELFNPVGEDIIVTAPTEEVDHMKRLLAEWHTRFGQQDTATADVRQLAVELELFPWFGDLTSDRKAQTRFGRILGTHELREFGGFRLKRGTQAKRTYWRCEPTEEGAHA